MYGIKVTSNGVVGWIVGKDADIWLFKDKASAAAELKKLKRMINTAGTARLWSQSSQGGGRNDR